MIAGLKFEPDEVVMVPTLSRFRRYSSGELRLAIGSSRGQKVGIKRQRDIFKEDCLGGAGEEVKSCRLCVCFANKHTENDGDWNYCSLWCAERSKTREGRAFASRSIESSGRSCGCRVLVTARGLRRYVYSCFVQRFQGGVGVWKILSCVPCCSSLVLGMNQTTDYIQAGDLPVLFLF